MSQYSTKLIFAVFDVLLIIGLNIGETDKVFTLISEMMMLMMVVMMVIIIIIIIFF